MQLTAEEQAMLDGKSGKAVQKAMQILVALGIIYEADGMIPVSSVQVAGVSYDNLGDAGLQFLEEMLEGGASTRVLTTLNPAGMDIEHWQELGINADFAQKQMQVIDTFKRIGILPTCTCTPYYSGNLPRFGEHIAWAESSAVCFANSVIGARTNREGGPGALAAALTGRTPNYGFHLSQNRKPGISFIVEFNQAPPENESTFWLGALGKAIGQRLETMPGNPVPYIRGIENASQEGLKSFCASLATYGGCALFHMEGTTPEASQFIPPKETVVISTKDIESAGNSLSDAAPSEVDFVSLGCPHLSIREIARIAQLLDGKQVKKEFWITTSRLVRQLADQAGYTRIIESSGAKIAADTCCVVAPIKGRFHAMATDSAKACFYARGKHRFKTLYKPFDEVVLEAIRG
jgi:predicted aconitase